MSKLYVSIILIVLTGSGVVAGYYGACYLSISASCFTSTSTSTSNDTTDNKFISILYRHLFRLKEDSTEPDSLPSLDANGNDIEIEQSLPITLYANGTIDIKTEQSLPNSLDTNGTNIIEIEQSLPNSLDADGINDIEQEEKRTVRCRQDSRELTINLDDARTKTSELCATLCSSSQNEKPKPSIPSIYIHDCNEVSTVGYRLVPQDVIISINEFLHDCLDFWEYFGSMGVSYALSEKCRNSKWMFTPPISKCHMLATVSEWITVCANKEGIVNKVYFTPMKKDLTLDQLFKLQILFNSYAFELLMRKKL
mgnify:CR=1 FL=1